MGKVHRAIVSHPVIGRHEIMVFSTVLNPLADQHGRGDLGLPDLVASGGAARGHRPCHVSMGTALGLLLVFRTNNSYLRLLEARSYWSESLICVREIAQGVATALLWDKRNRNNVDARDSAARVCRYLACFAWEMRARYMGGDALADTDVLHKLLPSDEADFIGAQRLRPLQLLAALRRELHDQYTEGWLPAHTHRKVRALLWCEVGRLPSGCVNRVCRRDPPPETCTRIPHVRAISRMSSSSRSLHVSVSVCRCQLFYQLEEDARLLTTLSADAAHLLLAAAATMARARALPAAVALGFPFVLAGTMAPLSVALWVLATSYALVGIDGSGPGGAARHHTDEQDVQSSVEPQRNVYQLAQARARRSDALD